MQARDQEAITQKLHQYLSTQNNIEPFLENLSTQRYGYCFSLSLCRAAMRITGKLAWWNAARDAILAWDGDISSLQNEFILPGAKENKPISLQTLFEKIINHIVFNQANKKLYPHILLSQADFLDPGGLFLLLNENDEILPIKHNYHPTGYFDNSSDDLIKILEDIATIEAIKNNICLIHSDTHTCELSFADGKWHLYDPNYLDGNAKSFIDIEDLVEEIGDADTLGEKICIELACIEDLETKPFTYFYDLFTNHPEQLLENNNCIYFLKYNPELTPQFFENLKNVKVLNTLNLNKGDEHGTTVLIFAAAGNYHAAIKTLCANGADPDQVTTDGWSALLYAAELGHTEVISALLDSGADIDLAHPNGCTALMLAAQKGHIDVVNELISRGADLTCTMSAITSILFDFAKKQDRYLEVEALFKMPNNIISDDVDEFTALHLAVFFGHADIVIILLDKIEDVEDETLNDLSNIARALGHSEIFNLIESRILTMQQETIELSLSQGTGFTLFDNSKNTISHFSHELPANTLIC